MTILSLIASTIAAFIASYWLTGHVLAYALVNAIIDVPNHRSSHSEPTPRGGGWGVVLPSLSSVALACALGYLSLRVSIGLAGGGAAIAATGWTDDRRGLSAMVRLIIHIAGAIWLIAWMGGVPVIDLGSITLTVGGFGSALAMLAIVWSTNLYNFMDGIDGLAGTEAVLVAATGGTLLLLGGATGLALIALSTAAAGMGFLMWNRPPARIFMGDVGSSFLGFMLAGLALAGERQSAVPSVIWVMLLGAFVGDATLTLLWRMAKRERWYSGHRQHIYQRLVQSGWSHAKVDLTFACVDSLLAVCAVVAWYNRSAITSVLAISASAVVFTYVFAARRFPLKMRGDSPQGGALGGDR